MRQRHRDSSYCCPQKPFAAKPSILGTPRSNWTVKWARRLDAGEDNFALPRGPLTPRLVRDLGDGDSRVVQFFE
jgi:hypothetical protein